MSIFCCIHFYTCVHVPCVNRSHFSLKMVYVLCCKRGFCKLDGFLKEFAIIILVAEVAGT